MKKIAALIVLSFVLAVVTCQTQGQTQGTTQNQSQGRQAMNPFMSMMLMRTIDNFFPLWMLMNQGAGGMMGGGLFPLLAANTIF